MIVLSGPSISTVVGFPRELKWRPLTPPPLLRLRANLRPRCPRRNTNANFVIAHSVEVNTEVDMNDHVSTRSFFFVLIASHLPTRLASVEDKANKDFAQIRKNDLSNVPNARALLCAVTSSCATTEPSMQKTGGCL